ncbi:lateral signaling target protein 2 homolog [Babylonia areolata]|uniref:lateral signaling target protein 2 homolog n=1 Tax=Babylonia areolata TaxID=304850 RepID=UPI003FD35440
MNSLRKWLYKPKKTDKSLLAQFYFADEELNTVASELDSFDSRKDPERCQALVAQLRACQDKVLTIVQRMMTEAIPFARSSRDFRVKFPDDVVQENLAGQLWFGAECLAAGSSIMNRELESASMRPLARALTKNLDSLRHILRDQCLVNVNEYTERIREALTIFDKLFAEFELSYVSAMVPVKSVKEYETIQEITVLFSETVIRAKSRGYVTTDMIDEYDPALMFTIPRLAIVCGLLVFGDGPLNPDNQSLNMSDMFRPFQTLLYKIRELLYTLSEGELLMLERALCSQEEPDFLSSTSPPSKAITGRSVSTATIAVQTDSPALRGKGRDGDAASCSSADRLDDDDSEDISLTPEKRRMVDKGRTVEHIQCQSGRLSETPPSDAAFCELEDVAAGQATSEDSSRQPKNLNKSDSNDSGLHSDMVSACDSQFTVSPSGSSQLISQSGCVSPPQSPLVDEVMEICMEHTDTDSHMADDPSRSASAELSSVQEVQPSVDDRNGLQGDECDKSLFNVDGSDTSPRCEDCSDERISGEEDSFYTPSSGVSPLHQPLCDSDDRSASHHTGAELPTHHSAQRVTGSEDSDENKENIEGLVDVGSPSELRNLESSSGHVYSVLQRVQQAFASNGGSSACVDRDTGNGDDSSDVNNSSFTDSTLTDLTPPDRDIPFSPSPRDFQLYLSVPRDSDERTLTAACPAECDTDDNVRCLSQSMCDGDDESQNQKCVSESKLASDCVVAGAGVAVDSEKACLGAASSAVTETDTNAESSCKQCDRCTQTPHSAINNDQSSKIYHHHHHQHHHHHHHHTRSHSSPQAASSSSSVPAQDTPPNCDPKQRDGSRQNDEKRNCTVSAQQASSVHSQSSSATVKKRGVEKSPTSAGKRSHGSKSRKALLRSRKNKSSQHSEAEREARLRQYEDNWSNCSSNTNSDSERKGRRKAGGSSVKVLPDTSSGSSCEESTSGSDCESEEESCGSSETSSYNSESHDDEEIALAVQAAELANRNQARARFRSSSDMIHRLFVCISGVADQLQTNFAGDLRNILRVVFNLNCSEPVIMEDEKAFRHHRRRGARFFHQQFGGGAPQNSGLRDPPAWVPDDQSTMCMSCKTPFTFVRRRHHCRNCGKIFCGRCSSNAVSLPHFGHSKPVRVCNHCFVFQVNPFAMQAQI